MKESTIDSIGQIFWYGILATPLISFLIVRKCSSLNRSVKVIKVIAIAFLLACVFLIISWSILMRNGLGPR